MTWRWHYHAPSFALWAAAAALLVADRGDFQRRQGLMIGAVVLAWVFFLLEGPSLPLAGLVAIWAAMRLAARRRAKADRMADSAVA
jgi:hypothetical protein